MWRNILSNFLNLLVLFITAFLISINKHLLKNIMLKMSMCSNNWLYLFTAVFIINSLFWIFTSYHFSIMIKNKRDYFVDFTLFGFFSYTIKIVILCILFEYILADHLKAIFIIVNGLVLIVINDIANYIPLPIGDVSLLSNRYDWRGESSRSAGNISSNTVTNPISNLSITEILQFPILYPQVYSEMYHIVNVRPSFVYLDSQMCRLRFINNTLDHKRFIPYYESFSKAYFVHVHNIEIARIHDLCARSIDIMISENKELSDRYHYLRISPTPEN